MTTKPTRIGPYVVSDLLGEGGMARVYRARREGSGRDLALKVLTESKVKRIPEFLSRFQREARAMAALRHPHIVAVEEAGSSDGVHYLAMELVTGESLKDRLGRGPLSVGEVLRLMAETADAVGTVHAQGILHRDLKPTNIFIQTSGASKLLDFGLAKGKDDGIVTNIGRRLGTPRYMPPEVVRGRSADERSDVYQLGLVYHEALTGRSVIPDMDMYEALKMILTDLPPPLAGTVVGVTPEVDAVLAGCLAKEPAARFANGLALAAAVARLFSPPQ